MFIPSRTSDSRPFNRASNTVDHCLSAPTGAWLGVYSRHQLFITCITDEDRPFNGTSNTVDRSPTSAYPLELAVAYSRHE
ncbi:hypothetical protein BC497_28805 (plasmid) [Klebsiella variicola]|nr:hypothetical protein BC497_28805 [Klebsiella variicola]